MKRKWSVLRWVASITKYGVIDVYARAETTAQRPLAETGSASSDRVPLIAQADTAPTEIRRGYSSAIIVAAVSPSLTCSVVEGRPYFVEPATLKDSGALIGRLQL
jgi:hypothetical protein